MKRSFMRRIVVAAALGCLLFAAACSDSDPVSPKTEAKFKQLTDKENLIYNLMQSYKYCNIEEYTKLLHTDYIWTNQEQDVIQLGMPVFYSRDTDIEKTGNMFKAKLGVHPDPSMKLDRLNLTIISAGSWQQVAEFGGEPCEDCWETTRNYSLELHFTASDMFLISYDLVRFTVAGVQANGRTEYRILRADDIDDPQAP